MIVAVCCGPCRLPCCGSVALVLSFTRSAWIGLVAGLVVAAMMRKPKALLLIPVVILAGAVIAPLTLRERVVSIFDPFHPTNYERLCMVTSGLGMIRDHPLTGVGIDMVEPAYPEYRAADAPHLRIPHLHNNVVQIAAERGLPTLVAYLAILAVFFRRSAQILGGEPSPVAPAVGGCLLAIVGISVAGLFEYNWGDAEVWIPTLACLSTPFASAGEERR